MTGIRVNVRSHPLGVLTGAVELPALVLHREALAHNIELMQGYADRFGLSLAPHAKTIMAPQLLRAQLDAGAWGITVATVAHAAVAVRAGARRVLVANEVVAPDGGARLARMTQDTGTRTFCLVDSARGIERLDEGVRTVPGARVGVLIEVGEPGGRCGVRSAEDALFLGRLIAASGSLDLVGVEGYEGTVGHDRRPETLERVDAYLNGLAEAAVELWRHGLVAEEPVVVSAGGARYIDRVAAVLGPRRLGDPPMRVLARPGSYVLHGWGNAAAVAALDASQVTNGDALDAALIPAAEVWGEVLSAPERGRAFVGFGGKHVDRHAGMPRPLRLIDDDGVTDLFGEGLVVRSMDDHHAYVDTGGFPLVVGQWMALGMAYPVSLERWRRVPLVNDDHVPVDHLHTEFQTVLEAGA